MEMEHTHIARKANLFSHRKKPPQGEVILLRSCWMKSESTTTGTNQKQLAAVHLVMVVVDGWDRVGWVGCLPGWFPLQMRPWKQRKRIPPGTRLLLLLLVLLWDSLACSCCVPEGCRTFSARPDQVRIVAVNINFNYDSHHPFKAVRRYASWNQLANTAKPNRTEPQKEQQHHLYALLCLCLIGKVCDDHYDGLRIYNRWINQIALLGKHCTPIRSTGWGATSV